LGGNSYLFDFSLDVGETTIWKLRTSSSIVDETNYPDFSLGSFRAYTID
jgi:hypothetical protein